MPFHRISRYDEVKVFDRSSEPVFDFKEKFIEVSSHDEAITTIGTLKVFESTWSKSKEIISGINLLVLKSDGIQKNWRYNLDSLYSSMNFLIDPGGLPEYSENFTLYSYVWAYNMDALLIDGNGQQLIEGDENYWNSVFEPSLDKSIKSMTNGIELSYYCKYIDCNCSVKKEDYVKWTTKMAVGLGVGIPRVMCEQVDALESILDPYSGYCCDGLRPNSNKKPISWMGNLDRWYTSWDGWYLVEDIAFAVAHFSQRGGSFQIYYMYCGVTNFGRTSGDPNHNGTYDYDAFQKEYGLLRLAKWEHLKHLHTAIKLCENALVAVDLAQCVKSGPQPKAHVYRGNVLDEAQTRNFFRSKSNFVAFLASVDGHKAVDINLPGQVYQ